MDPHQQLSRWLAMAEVTAKGKIAKEVEAKANSNKCLVCEKKATGSRGLCVAHYLQFYRSMLELPKKERPAFEEEQIREGRVLASGSARKLRRPNPFTSNRKDAS